MNNDLISRDELKKAIKELYKETPDGFVRFGIEKVYEIINNAPTVHTDDCEGCPFCPDFNSGIPIGVE